ncbi:hypothetical protein ACLKA6_019845 [Drosophila palustris]
MVDIAVAKKRGRPSKRSTTDAVPAAGNHIVPTPKKPGRPRKAKARVSITGTGKQRGRPRKEPIPVQENSGNDEQDAANSPKSEPKQRKRKKVRKLGRPRKHHPSDGEENNDGKDAKIPRPVGRPPTGAVKWNIVRTGRKVGRPRTKRAAKNNNVKTGLLRIRKPKEIILSLEIEPLTDEMLMEMVCTPTKRGRPSL